MSCASGHFEVNAVIESNVFGRTVRGFEMTSSLKRSPTLMIHWSVVDQSVKPRDQTGYFSSESLHSKHGAAGLISELLNSKKLSK